MATNRKWITALRCWYCGDGERGEYIEHDGKPMCEACESDSESIADMDFAAALADEELEAHPD